MTKVQAPNGQIVEFPDGMPLDAIQRVMQEHFPPHSTPGAMGTPVGPTTAAPQPETPSFWGSAESNLRNLRLGTQAVGRGIGDLLGVPGDIESLAGNAIRSGVSGAIDMAGFPETAKSVSDAMQSVPNTFPTSEQIQTQAGDAIRGALGPNALLPEETERERVLGKIVELGTEGMLGSAAGIAGASTPAAGAAPVAEDAATVVGRWLGHLLSPGTREAAQAGRAASTFVGDTAAGAGAGAGSQLYDESGLRNRVHSFGEMLGAPETTDAIGRYLATLSGGMAGGTSKVLAQGTRDAAKAGGRSFADMVGLSGPRKDFIDPATGKPWGKLTTQVAGEYMRSPNGVNAGPPTAQAIEDAQNQMRNDLIVGPEQPTTGQLVGNQNVRVPMLEHQRRLQDQAPFIERDMALQQGAKQRVESVAPGQPGAPDAGRAFTDTFEQRASQRRQAAANDAADQIAAQQQRADQADQLRKSASDQLRERASEPNVSAARERVNKDVTDELTAAQQQRSALYDEMAQKFGNEQVPLSGVKGEIGKMLSNVGATGKTEDVLPPDLVNRFSGAESDSVKSLTSLGPALRDMENAARTAGNHTKADNIARVRKAIRASIQAFGEASSNPELRDLSQRIQKFETEDFGPRFRTGAADDFRKSFNRDRQQEGGRGGAAGSQTLKTFIQAGQPEKAQQLRQMMGQSKLQGGGEDAIRTHLIADLVGSGAVRADGTVNEAAARKWIHRWGEDTLQQAAPGLVNDVDNMLRNARSLDEQGRRAAQAAREEIARVRENLKLTQAEIDKGALGFAIGKSPEKAVSSIMGSGDPERAMRSVVSEIGDNQQARDGLKQAVREYLLQKVENSHSGIVNGRPVSMARLDNMLAEHKGALSQVFSEDEMRQLQRAHAMLKNQGLVKNIQALGNSATASRDAEMQRMRDALEGFVKLKFGMLRGGGLLRSLKVVARAVSGEKLSDTVNRMLTQAMLDPELAKMLMTKVIPENSPAWDRRLVNILGLQQAESANDR